jgi:hypothetical protein
VDKVALLAGSVVTVAVLATSGCGSQSASTDDRQIAAAPTPTPGDASTASGQTQPPAPTESQLGDMSAVGITADGKQEQPAEGQTSYAQAAQAALARNGGLMADGLVPDRAWFGSVRTSTFGESTGSGDTESMIPAVDDAPAWILVYEHSLVPPGGGRGSQEPGSNPSTSSTRPVEVTLVVIVDGKTGQFVIGRNL